MKKTNSSKVSGKREAVKERAPIAATLSEAQRLAATILECLAGLRTPMTASQVLGISLPRYYLLETRALDGLVASLAPRMKGKHVSLEVRIKQLEKELESARRACARQEALVRITQRSLGLSTLPKTPARPPVVDGKRRKTRRPSVRAMKAAKLLRAKSEVNSSVSTETLLQTMTTSSNAGES